MSGQRGRREKTDSSIRLCNVEAMKTIVPTNWGSAELRKACANSKPDLRH